MNLLYLACYAGLAVLVLAVVFRALRILKLPLHLRWELYPVAHEKGRARYGGSYMEESEWWTKPRETSKLGELKVMVPEILLLKGVREENRSQWIRTWPFHVGLYFLVGATVLLLFGGVFGVTAPGGFFGTLIPILGYAGFGLGLLGAVALLVRRMANLDYREYTTPLDYMNLILFVGAFGLGLVAQLATDADFLRMRGFFVGLLTFGDASLAPIAMAEVALMALLTAYVPLTHMSHFFTKYFMYHDIRWSDEPLVVGGKLEKRVGGVLGLKPTWAADHIRGDGEKTWVDIAVSDGFEREEGGES